MTEIKNMDRAAGSWFIRTLLGVVVLMQGIGKVFTWGLPKIYGMWFADFEKTFLPKWLIWTTACFTSYTELVAGILLIIGWQKRLALYLLAVDLLIVSFGHGLLEPIWDLQHVMPRAILVAALFLLPEEWDRWQLAKLMRGKNVQGL